jgi:hypothetical protein
LTGTSTEIVLPQTRPCAAIVRGYWLTLQVCGVVSVQVVEQVGNPLRYLTGGFPTQTSNVLTDESVRLFG